MLSASVGDSPHFAACHQLELPMSVVELHCVNTRDVGTSPPVTGAWGVSGLGTTLLHVFLQANVL